MTDYPPPRLVTEGFVQLAEPECGGEHPLFVERLDLLVVLHEEILVVVSNHGGRPRKRVLVLGDGINIHNIIGERLRSVY